MVNVKRGLSPIDALNAKGAHSSSEYCFATFIQYRNPELKIHRTKGHATSAVRNKSYQGKPWWKSSSEGIKIYEKQEDTWVDVTNEWIERDTQFYEEVQTKIEERRRLQSLCWHPCEHCSVRPC